MSCGNNLGLIKIFDKFLVILNNNYLNEKIAKQINMTKKSWKNKFYFILKPSKKPIYCLIKPKICDIK